MSNDRTETGFEGDENMEANGLMKRDGGGGGTLHSGDNRLWDDEEKMDMGGMWNKKNQEDGEREGDGVMKAH